MRVGFVKDDAPQALPRNAFWSRGKISLVEMMAAVGILLIMAGIATWVN